MSFSLCPQYLKHTFFKVSSIRIPYAFVVNPKNTEDNRCPLTISCRWSKLPTKRITRLASDIEFREDEVLEGAISENDKPAVKLVNRNPRNLEQLQFERKPVGFELDSRSVSYWNKLVFNRQRMAASVVHHSGFTIISVPATELADLTSSSFSDVSAAVNLGVILAKRCLESGILFVYSEFTNEERRSLKVQSFLKALKDNGLVLREPDFVSPRRKRDL